MRQREARRKQGREERREGVPATASAPRKCPLRAMRSAAINTPLPSQGSWRAALVPHGLREVREREIGSGGVRWGQVR